MFHSNQIHFYCLWIEKIKVAYTHDFLTSKDVHHKNRNMSHGTGMKVLHRIVSISKPFKTTQMFFPKRDQSLHQRELRSRESSHLFLKWGNLANKKTEPKCKNNDKMKYNNSQCYDGDNTYGQKFKSSKKIGHQA